MAARSLRAHLLRMLLPPIAAALALGAVISYFPTLEPATQAYDQALVDIGLALGSHVRVMPTEYRFELPPAVEQVLRTDRFDRIYYRVLGPLWRSVWGLVVAWHWFSYILRRFPRGLNELQAKARVPNAVFASRNRRPRDANSIGTD